MPRVQWSVQELLIWPTIFGTTQSCFYEESDIAVLGMLVSRESSR